jgi:ABC-type Fe3+ transport system permease subunit
MINEILPTLVFIGGREHSPIGIIFMVILGLFAIAFKIWLHRDMRQRGWEQPEPEKQRRARTALNTLHPSVLSALLIFISLIVMTWLLARPN